MTYATGRRITVRLLAGGVGPSGGPALRDVVGTLRSVADDTWEVIDRRGTAHPIDTHLVVAATVVPDVPTRLRTASDIDVASLECIAAEGWQPLESEPLGQWLMRAAAGFTGRANSVLALGDPGRPLDEALHAVRAWYITRGLTPMMAIPLPLCDDLDGQLDTRGWSPHRRTHVMVCDLAPLIMSASASGSALVEAVVDASATPSTDWLAAFRYDDQPLPTEAITLMTKNEHPVFVSARTRDGELVATGRGAVTSTWLGITAVEVAEQHRRQGWGRLVIGALAAYAANHGVRHVYLQVARDNEPAITLYRQLGFAHHHDYVYRRDDAG